MPRRSRASSRGRQRLDGNHFGAIIDAATFHRLCARLEESNAHFIVSPHVQHEGTPRERRKAVLCDPSGNAIELKCYREPSQICSPRNNG